MNPTSLSRYATIARRLQVVAEALPPSADRDWALFELAAVLETLLEWAKAADR